MPADRADGIDLSSFLIAVNAVIAAAILVLYAVRGPNDYVGTYTVCLSLAFAAQNFFFLLVTGRRPNPFLLLLVVHALVFYELRVATLLWEPWSMVFVRNSFGAADLGNGLLFVILSNFAIFFGVTAHSEKYADPAPLAGDGRASVRLLLPVLLLNIAVLLEFNFKALSALKGYLGIFLNADILLLFSLVVMVLYYDVMSKRQKALLFCSIFVFIASRTVSGSRSAMVTLCFYLFCVWFGVNGRVLFRKKLYMALLAALPVAVSLFLFATAVRSPRLQLQARTIFDRIGFLDMSSEVIANRLPYSAVINFEHYFKSVVDSGLTPGFSVFEAPKAANLLSFINNGMPAVSLKAVHENYESDMFTVYAEPYVLFGPVWGLIAIFAAAFLFQRAYRSLAGRDLFKLAVFRATLLVLFYTYFLDSFGIDWFLVDMIRFAVPFTILLFLFAKYAQYIPNHRSGASK